MQQLNLFSLEEKFMEEGKKIFILQDLILYFGIKKRAAEGFLSYNARKGKIIRLRRGLYCLKKNFPDTYFIANSIYKPSYISLETALSYHHIIPETVYSMTSITPKATREFGVEDISYSYQRIKKEAFTGYVLEEIDGEKIYIASPEKALADYGYFMSLGKKSWNDRTDLKDLDRDKLKAYLKLFKKKKLTTFLRSFISDL